MHRKFAPIAGTPTNKTVRRTRQAKTSEHKQTQYKMNIYIKKDNHNQCRSCDV